MRVLGGDVRNGPFRRRRVPPHLRVRLLVLLVAWTALGPHPASPASTADPVIAAAGDIVCASNFPTATTCRHRYTADILKAGDFDAVLTLGDNQYEIGALTAFQRYYNPTWGAVKAITHPAPGNHEYGTPQAAGYFAYFGAAAGDRTKGYYSFNLGSWHLIALNSNCDSVGGCDRGSPQELWLRADLAQHQNACTLAYWHHPRFVSGSVHEGDTRMEAFWQALYEFHADVVLSSHAHNYERFALQTPTGTADPANGIREFIVGTGGRNLHLFGPTVAPNSVVRHDETFGVLKMTLHATSYDWEFIPEAGKTFTDSGTASCTGLPPEPIRKTVVLKAQPLRVPPGKKAELEVTVLPCQGHEGDPVRFQQRRDHAWRTVATKASDLTCTASIERKVKRATRFRAISPADGDSTTGTSDPIKVRVRKPRVGD
jgi:acid phosphatase type 7